MKTKSRRRQKACYEPLIDLPPLSPEEYDGLYQSIALYGVLNAILVDSDGSIRRIIEGVHRKKIAEELGYECPEVVYRGDEEELRALARSLNLARRHFSTEQKRRVIADQLRETPDKTNRVIAKMLGVSHPTVASVRADLESVGKIYQQDWRVGSDGKRYKTKKGGALHAEATANRRSRLNAVALRHGDCRKEMKKIATGSIDAVIADPIYPEVTRDYGRISEEDWHDLMHEVVAECHRVLTPRGSAVFILQPNFERIGRMRLWLWDFVCWAGRAFKDWGLVQDVTWWSSNALPTHCASRTNGLLRQSAKFCVWIGPANCYRNQDAVLWNVSDATAALRWSDRCLQRRPSGHSLRPGRTAETAIQRGGSTPFNVLPIAAANPAEHCGHPASTPYELADWWCRYLLPPGGVLLDPFCGSGTMLAAALDRGASKVIGIDRENKYLVMTKKRLREG